ncbi:hypothetical protein Hanom_Chr02g00175341 [Helianthus anomalus]
MLDCRSTPYIMTHNRFFFSSPHRSIPAHHTKCHTTETVNTSPTGSTSADPMLFSLHELIIDIGGQDICPPPPPSYVNFFFSLTHGCLYEMTTRIDLM